VGAASTSDGVKRKWYIWVHQTQAIKGKEDTEDLRGRDAKSEHDSSRSRLYRSGEKSFFCSCYPFKLVYVLRRDELLLFLEIAVE